MTNESKHPEGPFIATALSAAITVKDLDASLAWYTNVVGFTIGQKHEREGKVVGVSLEAGTIRIFLGQDDGKLGWERKKGEGFSFQLTTAQDIDEVANRIKAAGGTLAMEPADMPWGARVFRLVDPDGFKIVISS